MNPLRSVGVVLVLLCFGVFPLSHNRSHGVQKLSAVSERSYLGFDRNIYPGDASLPILRKAFAFTSYWLSPPPGEKEDTWRGKREQLDHAGFGFLLLYKGRANVEVRIESKARDAGMMDARNAVESAKNEGFAAGAIIFLDIEEGGRLTPAYHVYLRAWRETLTQFGYRPGVYCSGITFTESPGGTITTAADIHDDANLRDLAVWVFNDVCPPSPGCSLRRHAPTAYKSGIFFADVWQFAQSPRRKERTAHCPAKYAPDGNCYASGDTDHKWFLDVNTATSSDPSGGAK